MTKLIVASDSHGSSMALQRVLDKEQDARALFFLGDGLRDLETACAPFPGLWVYAVAGNCDLGALEPAEAVTAFDGVNLLYTHGHLHGPDNPPPLAPGDCLVCGHTHLPVLGNMKKGFTYLNPGPLSLPKEGTPKSYLLLRDGKFTWHRLDDGAEFDPLP